MMVNMYEYVDFIQTAPSIFCISPKGHNWEYIVGPMNWESRPT